MAPRTRALSGKDASFLIGKFDYSDIFSMVGLSTTRDKADVTVLKDLGKAYVPGHFDGTLRLSGIFSAVEDKELQSYVEEASEPIISTLILGNKRLDRAKMSQIVTSEYGIDTPVDDKAGISGSGQASGLMHHCVALTNVGQQIAAATNLTDLVTPGAKTFIDLGDGHKWKRVRLHVHLTAKGAGLTGFSVKVTSGAAVTGNNIQNPTNRNGAAGVNIFGPQMYVFEFKAPEGQTVDRHWTFLLTPTGGAAGGTVTAAFGRSQE